MKNTTEISSELIFTMYGDYILNRGHRPTSVYAFAKANNFEEKEFYHFFANFHQIEKEIINHFFQKSFELVFKEPGAKEMSAKEKLLNVYFVFFENLTMNRSLVLTLLKNSKLEQLKTLEALRTSFFNFIDNIDFKNLEIFENARDKTKKLFQKSRHAALWLHLLSIIEFWKNDNSADFVKTDIFIEKTIDSGFELVENEALRKLFDLGKFLWQEKIKTN